MRTSWMGHPWVVLGLSALGMGGSSGCDREATGPALVAVADDRASTSTRARGAADAATVSDLRPTGRSEDGASEAAPAGTARSEGPPTPVSRAPAWTRRGAYWDGDTLWAVGRVAGVRDVALARAVAGGRARAELARALASVHSRREDEAPPTDESHALVALHLRGVEIVDHWTDPESGVIFARARWVTPRAGERP